MEETFNLLGEDPYTLEEGTKETVACLTSDRGAEADAGGS
jgi:hypothetical protein